MRVKQGGRRKGTRNKATAAKAAEIAASGLTPLDYMLNVMRNEALPMMTRLEAAKLAAPYVHPRLAAIAHSVENDEPRPQLDALELARRAAFLLMHPTEVRPRS